MVDGKSVCAGWQSLLEPYRGVFTRPGWRRFAQWVTGMALCQEEQILTRALLAMGLEDQWSAQERFAAEATPIYWARKRRT